MADEYDFQINDLKFRAAISDKYPYQRTTAPFRKEQFDSSPTVGDQSLTGWWTRGQLSFHKGEGKEYYEVLDGETVLNSYYRGVGVNPFTPGKVSLVLERTSLFTTAVTDCLALAFLSSPSRYVLNDDGVPKVSDFMGGALSTLTLSAGTANALCGDGTSRAFAGTSASKVERFTVATSGTPAGTVIYTTPTAVSGLWWAKERLWIATIDGEVFAETADPSAPPVALTTPLATLPDHSSGGFADPCLAAAGQAVYVGWGGREIYRFGLADDGSVPTLAAPVVAAELPNDEEVQGLRYYLGMLVIATNKGVRVAMVQDNGDLVYGPLFISETSTSGVMGATGSQVWVPKGLDVYVIDLSSPSEDNPLAFPYAKHSTGSDSSYAAVGVVEGGVMAHFAGSDVSGLNGSSYNSAADGYVETGFHRFGTLDTKSFRSITVRATVNYGSIEVYSQNESRSSTLLGTITAPATEGTFPLDITGERVAFMIRLLRDPASPIYTPVLLGYQLKAMPVPERQRILRAPLQLVDLTTLRNGAEVGREGKGYEDLVALE
ncbi:MAG: hypothetical protein ACLGIS_12820, partial [Actinomycetes bacterium]